jgi:LmbE family N-acetylglucosaminyl deacetylase
MRYHQLDAKIFNKKSVFVFAHQDDELYYSGLISRLKNSKFIWITNGDGLAKRANIPARKYAKIRSQESKKVMNFLGVKNNQIKELGVSEVALSSVYKRIKNKDETALEEIKEIADKLYNEIKKSKAEVIWTLSFQAGHLGHDLAHLLSVYVKNRIEKEENRKIDIFAFPEYEFTTIPPFFIPFRFRPFSHKEAYKIYLSDKEWQTKLKAIDMYPSQRGLFKWFKIGINVLGFLSAAIGKPFNYQKYGRTEVFERVKQEDYSKSPHLLPWEDYMFSTSSFKVTKVITLILKR